MSRSREMCYDRDVFNTAGKLENSWQTKAILIAAHAQEKIFRNIQSSGNCFQIFAALIYPTKALIAKQTHW